MIIYVEHKKLDELKARITNSPMILSDIENSVLENNIFGVDLNDEAVEIAKLSMWLKTAQKGRKLSVLTSNIKCGNSLIDDKIIAGEKAFNWQNEFPEIFANGGFNVIVGNPPYVFARDKISEQEKKYYSANYVSAKYQVNTYLLFIEQTIRIIKDKGFYGLIVPNAWLMVSSASNLRQYILETSKLNEIINLSGYSFTGVNVETIILSAQKNIVTNNEFSIKLSQGQEFVFSHKRQQEIFKQNDGFEFKVFADEISDKILAKIATNSYILDNVSIIKAGLQAYEVGKGNPKQTQEDVKNRPYDYSYKFDETTFQYLDGKDVNRYQIDWNGLFLKYGDNLAAPRTFDLFSGKKIIIREITGKYPKSIIAAYTEDIYLFNRSNIAVVERPESEIDLKYILAVLNSSLISYYFLKNTPKSVRQMFPKVILQDLRKFPLKKISIEEQKPIILKVNLILELCENLTNIRNRFLKFLKSKYENLVITSKLENIEHISFNEFSNELIKQKIRPNISEQAEWLEFFEKQQCKAIELQSEINKTDKEINQIVYDLYNLTDEEITIIENC